MRLISFATLTVAAVGAALLLSGDPADAARKRQKEDFFFSSQRERVVQSRPRSRITVRRRSYLDPGPELLPGEYKYREYATPYGYSAIDTILPPGQGWNRTPFNDPFDVPGRPWPGSLY